MIAVVLIVFFGLLAVSILVLVLLRSASLEHESRAQLLRLGAETLAYDVPEGQDPADVIVVLNRAGYTAIEDGAAYRVLVHCQQGRRPRKAHRQCPAGKSPEGSRAPNTSRSCGSPTNPERPSALTIVVRARTFGTVSGRARRRP